MSMRAALQAFAVTGAIALGAASTASASTYTVAATDNGDPVVASGTGCGGSAPNFTCVSLRSAVTAANANAKDADSIQLGEATYTLAQASALTLTSPITITGVSARRTAIQGNGATRVIDVSQGSATLQQLTVRGGRETAAGELGGDIRKTAVTLNLIRVRVSDGQAINGGGIANLGGPLNVTESLVDNNRSTSTSTAAGGGVL